MLQRDLTSILERKGLKRSRHTRITLPSTCQVNVLLVYALVHLPYKFPAKAESTIRRLWLSIASYLRSSIFSTTRACGRSAFQYKVVITMLVTICYGNAPLLLERNPFNLDLFVKESLSGGFVSRRRENKQKLAQKFDMATFWQCSKPLFM